MIEIIGKNGIKAKLIKDSKSMSGKRMSTFELDMPRIILAESNTHRATSKNASSSRAIPLKTAIQNIIDNPFYPVYWGKNQPGMQAKEELHGEDLDRAKMLWCKAIRQNLDVVREFEKLGVHKQISARWLETSQIIKCVTSGTDWDNLLWLRNDEEAQPEYEELAKCIQECFRQSEPELLLVGEWHLPYIETKRVGSVLQYLDSNGDELTLEEAKMISASCCAQVSYRKLNDTKEKAIEIYNKLFSGRKPHMSPTEHAGTPIHSTTSKNVPFDFSTWENGVTHVDRTGGLHSGNLTGWIQLRQTLPNNVYKNGV